MGGSFLSAQSGEMRGEAPSNAPCRMYDCKVKVYMRASGGITNIQSNIAYSKAESRCLATSQARSSSLQSQSIPPDQQQNPSKTQQTSRRLHETSLNLSQNTQSPFRIPSDPRDPHLRHRSPHLQGKCGPSAAAPAPHRRSDRSGAHRTPDRTFPSYSSNSCTNPPIACAQHISIVLDARKQFRCTPQLPEIYFFFMTYDYTPLIIVDAASFCQSRPSVCRGVGMT